MRAAMIRAGDPLCRMRVHGRDLLMPLSHRLPINLAAYPAYDSLWTDVAVELRRRTGGRELHIVDVGANIGQTLLALGLRADDHAMAFEPCVRFADCARENLSHLDVAIFGMAMTDELIPRPAVRLITCGGTAAFRASQRTSQLRWNTVDDVVGKWAGLDLMKVDTDGMDAMVLAGAALTINRLRPVVAWECGPFGQGDAAFAEQAAGPFHRLDVYRYTRFDVYSNVGPLLGRWSCGQAALAAVLRAVRAGAPYCDVVAWPPAGGAR